MERNGENPHLILLCSLSYKGEYALDVTGRIGESSGDDSFYKKKVHGFLALEQNSGYEIAIQKPPVPYFFSLSEQNWMTLDSSRPVV